MFTEYYTPHLALSEFVETICLMGHEFITDDVLSPICIYMPNHLHFLCFHLEDPVNVKKNSGDFEERSRALIIGPQLLPVTLDLGKKYTDLVIVFKPCGLYRLLGIPLKEIVDCDFDACLILGKEINEVTERLMEASSNEKRNAIVQEYLLDKLVNLKPALPIDKAMLQLVRTQGNLSIDFLAAQSCLSVRQLERQSLERIGLPPKCFARVIRFSEAYKFRQRNPHTSWTEIACGFGYYDQMHLIRDFRHFTGVNPSTIKENELVHSLRLNALGPNT